MEFIPNNEYEKSVYNYVISF